MNKTITFEDFSKIDLRVGTIIEVNDFPKAHKPAYQLTIDFGDLGLKKTSAQITTLYTKAQLLNRQVVANINFAENIFVMTYRRQKQYIEVPCALKE